MILTSTPLSKGDSEKAYPIWITGAEALMDSLKIAWRSNNIWISRGAITSLLQDAVHKAEKEGWLKHYMVRPEQGGSRAADGYARATGEVGVCFGTSGPGATNLVTGIATAQMDSVPMVVVTGQVPRPAIGTDELFRKLISLVVPFLSLSILGVINLETPPDIAKVVSEAFFYCFFWEAWTSFNRYT